MEDCEAVKRETGRDALIVRSIQVGLARNILVIRTGDRFNRKVVTKGPPMLIESMGQVVQGLRMTRNWLSTLCCCAM
jgi:hypothetical protein